MTRKANELTDALAQATSRRGFLGRLARTAGTAVAAMTGILATRSAAGGAGNGKGPRFKKRLCCIYWDGWDGFRFCTNKKSCPEELYNGILSHFYDVDNCDACH